ncbi:MAG: hypothetical protein GXP39_15450 [Chloroflexi bacterium]|nr:hypothetical protein [Chloroflexota bacterium]
MVSRAKVALIIANLGLVEGLTGPKISATIVVMVIFTARVTPLMLHALSAQPSQRLPLHGVDLPIDISSESEQS